MSVARAAAWMFRAIAAARGRGGAVRVYRIEHVVGFARDRGRRRTQGVLPTPSTARM